MPKTGSVNFKLVQLVWSRKISEPKGKKINGGPLASLPSLDTALPQVLLAFAVLLRDVAICSWARSPGSAALLGASWAGPGGAGAERGV